VHGIGVKGPLDNPVLKASKVADGAFRSQDESVKKAASQFLYNPTAPTSSCALNRGFAFETAHIQMSYEIQGRISFQSGPVHLAVLGLTQIMAPPQKRGAVDESVQESVEKRFDFPRLFPRLPSLGLGS